MIYASSARGSGQSQNAGNVVSPAGNTLAQNRTIGKLDSDGLLG
jgi:hypothetical protein